MFYFYNNIILYGWPKGCCSSSLCLLTFLWNTVILTDIQFYLISTWTRVLQIEFSWALYVSFFFCFVPMATSFLMHILIVEMTVCFEYAQELFVIILVVPNLIPEYRDKWPAVAKRTFSNVIIWFFFIKHTTRTFFGLFHSHKILHLLAPQWQIFLRFHILQQVKSLPFHIPEAWKRYPF